MELPIPARPALLIELLNGPDYGHKLAERIRLRTKGELSLLQGSLYPALGKLERGGLIESFQAEQPVERRGGRRMRQHYRLTPEGERVALRHRRAVAAMGS